MVDCTGAEVDVLGVRAICCFLDFFFLGGPLGMMGLGWALTWASVVAVAVADPVTV